MDKDFNERYKKPPRKLIAPVIGLDINDLGRFNFAIKLLKESLDPEVRETIFVGNNLVTWNRKLSFIRDPFYSNLFYDENLYPTEKSIIWTTYILLYFAEKALTISGHYLELGCNRRTYKESLLKRCNLNKHKKKYYLIVYSRLWSYLNIKFLHPSSTYFEQAFFIKGYLFLFTVKSNFIASFNVSKLT